MSSFLLQRETLIHSDIQAVWDFFMEPENLSKLTPDYMNFTTLTNTEGLKIHKGLIIEYKLTPFFKIPIRWKTLIIDVMPLHQFTDVQNQGPYKVWEHTHTFETVAGGVFMKDVVKYEMPFGFLGRFAHALFVKKQLEALFDYRTRQIKMLLPS